MFSQVVTQTKVTGLGCVFRTEDCWRSRRETFVTLQAGEIKGNSVLEHVHR